MFWQIICYPSHKYLLFFSKTNSLLIWFPFRIRIVYLYATEVEDKREEMSIIQRWTIKELLPRVSFFQFISVKTLMWIHVLSYAISLIWQKTGLSDTLSFTLPETSLSPLTWYEYSRSNHSRKICFPLKVIIIKYV